MANCNIRFCDNQKIVSGNYTFANEDASYPFTNALSTIRSQVFKATNNNNWTLDVDIGFPDTINAIGMYGPLGESLGITRHATVKIMANNINDFTSPPLDLTVPVSSDQQFIHFIEDTDANYRYWRLLINDPGNPDFISFGYIYMGDYTTTLLTNIFKGIQWIHRDTTSVTKSLNGTPYFDIKTRYDTFGGLKIGLALDTDRQVIEELYARVGIFTPMIISLDPIGITVLDKNALTRLARFNGTLSSEHDVFEYYSLSFNLEEVI